MPGRPPTENGSAGSWSPLACDDVGAVTAGQHDYVGRPPRRGRCHLLQVRQRAYPHRTRAGPGREPPGQQNLPVRRDHDSGAARQGLAGAAGQRLDGALIGTQPPASRAASAQATSHAYDRSADVSGTATVAVTTRPDAAEPGCRTRSAGSSCSRPSLRSGSVIIGLPAIVPSQPAGSGRGNTRGP